MMYRSYHASSSSDEEQPRPRRRTRRGRTRRAESATGENEVLAMGDCAINIHPTEDELVEIAGETAQCAKIFGVDPKVAFLSYSTLGSGKG